MSGGNDHQAALEASGHAAEEDFSDQAAGETTTSCSSAKMVWLEIRLVGEDGVGIPGAAYRILSSSDEVIQEGITDEDGYGGIQSLPEDDYQVTFPELDRDAWAPAPAETD